MSESVDLSKSVRQHTTTSKWRRAAIMVSLLLVLIASVLIFLLSSAVDREIARIATSSQLREQSDMVLIHLIELNSLERTFSINGSRQNYDQFQIISQKLNDVMDYISMIAHTNPDWEKWYDALKKEVDLNQNLLVQKINSKGISLQKNMSEIPIESNDDHPNVDRLNTLITSFFSGDNESRENRRAGIAKLRAALTLAAMVSVISTFVLAYAVINRFRRDITKLKTYQLLLHSENIALEERVRERTQELEAARNHAERERLRVEILLQDASHRIGNSLATVSSLLGLQFNRSENPEVRSALSAARDRIQTISAAHRRLRLGDDMETTPLAEFLQSVVNDVELGLPMELREKVQIETHFEDCHLSSRDATTLGIILGELLTNSIKHAFPNQKTGKIKISFGDIQCVNNSDLSDDNHKGQKALIVEDDGIGFDISNSQPNDGLGKLVIQQLCMQFGEKPIFNHSSKGGTRVVIPLPKLNIISSH
nr:sensor histidine kinase [Bartonella tamiae]